MKTEIVFLLIGLMIGAGSMYFFTYGTNSTGQIVLSDVECISSTHPAQYEVISGEECIHKRGMFGINTECSITLKNTESLPADFKAIFRCNNIDSDTPKIVETTTKPISAGNQETFVYGYQTSDSFKCILDKVESSDIQTSNPKIKLK